MRDGVFPRGLGAARIRPITGLISAPRSALPRRLHRGGQRVHGVVDLGGVVEAADPEAQRTCRRARRAVPGLVSTCEPLPPASAQAAPEEIAIRPPSERIKVSASARAIETWRLPGRRRSIAPLTSTPSSRERRPARRRSRSAAMRSASPAASASPARRAASPKPTMPGTFSVPERNPFSCPPPSAWAWSRRRGPSRSPDVERADALRAVHLVCRKAHEIRTPLVDVERRRVRSPAPRRSGTAIPRSRQRRPIAATGWMVPISLLAAITETRTVSGRSARSTSSTETIPSGADADHRDLEPLALERPARLQDRRVLDRGGHDVPAARAGGPHHAADGQVVRLRRARGEHDVRRARPR